MEHLVDFGLIEKVDRDIHGNNSDRTAGKIRETVKNRILKFQKRHTILFLSRVTRNPVTVEGYDILYSTHSRTVTKMSKMCNSPGIFLFWAYFFENLQKIATKIAKCNSLGPRL